MKHASFLPTFTIRAALIAASALTLAACAEQEVITPTPDPGAALRNDARAGRTQTFYGPAVPLGRGVGRAWVLLDAGSRTPLSIGLDVSAQSVMNQGDQVTEYTFQLPWQVAVAPYDHIELGWNPSGHEPDGIYTLPHFDLHFYMISPALQATIPFLAPPAFDVAPAPQYLPPGYVMGPGLVPNMGAHSVDVWSDEFQPGGVFSKTFIYGSYQGNITFLEPMITRAYLGKNLSETFPIRQPAAFQRAGYYPTSYTISYSRNPEQYHISLDHLTYHPAQ